MHTQPDTSSYQDRVQYVLRAAAQELPELIRGCRNVVEYRRSAKWDWVFRDYLACVRRYSDMCAEAEEHGFAGGKLTEALAPLPIWNDDYRWDDVLDRVGPALARAA
jgi:hypothetical protein